MMDHLQVRRVAPRDIFADMAQVRGLLERDGLLSVASIQRGLVCGYTYASRILAFVADSGMLRETAPGVYALAAASAPAPLPQAQGAAAVRVFATAQSAAAPDDSGREE